MENEKENLFYIDIDNSQLLQKLKSPKFLEANNLILNSKISFISDYLYDLILDDKDIKSNLDSPLYTKHFPNIELEEYIKRISSYGMLDEDSLVFICSIISYYREKCNIGICFNNIFNLLSGSMLITCKFFFDNLFTIDNYSVITSMSKKNLLLYEYEILNGISFELFILVKEYDDFKKSIFKLE